MLYEGHKYTQHPKGKLLLRSPDFLYFGNMHKKNLASPVRLHCSTCSFSRKQLDREARRKGTAISRTRLSRPDSLLRATITSLHSCTSSSLLWHIHVGSILGSIYILAKYGYTTSLQPILYLCLNRSLAISLHTCHSGNRCCSTRHIITNKYAGNGVGQSHISETSTMRLRLWA